MSLVTAAIPFLRHQRSPYHFEFFGLDIITDQANKCWLIEVNRCDLLNTAAALDCQKTWSSLIFSLYNFVSFRLPGLESSSANREEEDSLYDDMMSSLLKIVTKPLGSYPVAGVVDNSSTGLESDFQKPCHGFWNQVQGPVPVTFGSDNLWKNLMNWRLFTRNNRSKLVVKWGKELIEVELIDLKVYCNNFCTYDTLYGLFLLRVKQRWLWMGSQSALLGIRLHHMRSIGTSLNSVCLSFWRRAYIQCNPLVATYSVCNMCITVAHSRHSAQTLLGHLYDILKAMTTATMVWCKLFWILDSILSMLFPPP